jgi:hypothetical protein
VLKEPLSESEDSLGGRDDEISDEDAIDEPEEEASLDSDSPEL